MFMYEEIIHIFYLTIRNAVLMGFIIIRFIIITFTYKLQFRQIWWRGGLIEVNPILWAKAT